MRKILSLLAVLLLLCGWAFAQTRTVTGTVRDQAGKPVPFATITVAGTSNATSADANGNFSITVPQSGRLTVSSTGFQTVTIAPSGSGAQSITLATGGEQLSEVVVTTAQGLKREKRSLGYAAPTINNADLVKGQSSSPINALIGKVPGVNITSTSGAPGSSSRIVIRGGSSIGGTNQPLLVIDGVPIDNSSVIGGVNVLSSVDFGNRGNDLNPNDIESITVLKGPGATALYGSRASNGALIITTKGGRGSSNRKNEVTLNSTVTFSNVLKLPDFQNQYGQGYNVGSSAANVQLEFDPQENFSWGPKFDGTVRPWGQEINGVAQERPWSAVEDNVKDFFETGLALNNNLSFSGGNEKSSFYLSLSSLNSNGVYPTDRDDYDRYNVRFNGSTQLANKIKAGTSFTYSRINSDNVTGGQNTGSVYNQVLQTPRNIPLTEFKDLSNPYNSMGTVNENFYGYYGAYTYNPYWVLKNFHNYNNVDRVLGNFTLTYSPTTWLDITERIGGDIYTDSRTETDAKYSFRALDTTGGWYSASARTGVGRYYEGTYKIQDITHDLMVTIRKNITSDINASLLLGHNIRARKVIVTEAQTNAASGLVIPGFYNLANSNGPIAAANSLSKRRLVGGYAELNLGYKNFLFLGASARNDWSSTLPEENNSFFYPGVNASFVFSEVLKNTGVSKWLQYGKLRASWAQVGNDADPYLLESVYSKTTISSGFGSTTFPFGTNQIPGYTVGNTIGNPNLKPEITTASEVGVELGLFKSRVSVDFSYYKNESKNQILTVPVPASTGYTGLVSNLGTITNKGIELGLRGTPVKTNNLTWELYGTFTKNKNTVKGLSQQVVLGGFSGMSIVAANGLPYGQFFGRANQTDSLGRTIVSATTGIPLLTPSAVFLGSYNPDWQASLGTNLTFKSLSLGVLFDTKQGGKFYSRTKDITDFVGTAAETAVGDRMGYVFPNSVYKDNTGKLVENTSVKMIPENYWTTITDGMAVLDATYIKLREVNLTYSFGRDMLARTPFGTASIGLFGNNLWIKTAKENQFVDPEINSAGAGNAQGFDFTAQPSVRNYGINLKVTF